MNGHLIKNKTSLMQVLGRELIINYAKYLCNGWLRKRKRVVRLIETTSIHLLPSMNPDGHYKAAEVCLLMINHCELAFYTALCES